MHHDDRDHCLAGVQGMPMLMHDDFECCQLIESADTRKGPVPTRVGAGKAKGKGASDKLEGDADTSVRESGVGKEREGGGPVIGEGGKEREGAPILVRVAVRRVRGSFLGESGKVEAQEAEQV